MHVVVVLELLHCLLLLLLQMAGGGDDDDDETVRFGSELRWGICKEGVGGARDVEDTEGKSRVKGAP